VGASEGERGREGESARESEIGRGRGKERGREGAREGGREAGRERDREARHNARPSNVSGSPARCTGSSKLNSVLSLLKGGNHYLSFNISFTALQNPPLR
jgi:hypothetical protein